MPLAQIINPTNQESENVDWRVTKLTRKNEMKLKERPLHKLIHKSERMKESIGLLPQNLDSE